MTIGMTSGKRYKVSANEAAEIINDLKSFPPATSRMRSFTTTGDALAESVTINLVQIEAIEGNPLDR